jgi:hypothetical protein
MREGDVLATLLAAFGISLALFKIGVPSIWTAIKWATDQTDESNRLLQLFPGSTVDDLLLAGAIGALASIVVALLAFLNSLR